jgi:dynactin complex subunit
MQARPAPRRASVATAGLDAQNDLDLGDVVEVPGGNRGTVKYIGAIEGKNGLFAGVELSRDSASFGKNNGDVDGYVATS